MHSAQVGTFRGRSRQQIKLSVPHIITLGCEGQKFQSNWIEGRGNLLGPSIPMVSTEGRKMSLGLKTGSLIAEFFLFI